MLPSSAALPPAGATRVTRAQFLALAAAALAGGGAGPAGFPSRPVRLVSGFPPGGGTDILGRIVAQKFSELWPKAGNNASMFVENRSGAAGSVGAAYAARTPPDGYTLLLITNSHTITVQLQDSPGFDLQRDFAPVGVIATSPLVLAINPALPVDSVPALIAYARARPGQLNHGSAGAGTAPHLAGELFNIMAGTSMVHVPYRGTGPAVAAQLANEVQLSFGPLTAVEGFAREGQLRLLAVLGAERFAGLPELPTVAEGGLPDYAVDLWYALLAPAGTPPEVVAGLNADLARLLAQPEARRSLMEKGFTPAPASPAALGEVIAADMARWKAVIAQAQIRLE